LAVLTGGETGIDRFLKPGIGPEPREVFAWTQKQVNESTRRFLAALPGQLRFTLEGRRVLACHGSPRNVREYLYPDHPLEDLDRMMTRHQADLLFCGHTHRPFVRATSQGLAVNPGSVGKPKDGDPRASWALVEMAREVSANIMRVEYDLEQEAQRLRQAGLPAGTVERLLAGT
jgi:diadenosine tetraphosphatase ApaH/serine/threonine PP2A family protein phosphatase